MGRKWPPTPEVVAAVALFETARRARRHDISQAEENVFRLVNDAPEVIHPPVWAVMQSGSLGAVFVVAAELARRRRPHRATAALTFGTAAWGVVKAVKPIIGRGRPTRHLERVTVRGRQQTGLGYPSGHAAVALTLALVATHNGTPIARVGAVCVAGFTGLARMYVGAHLPYDVAGGFAIGLLGGRAANAALDRCG
jgi:undecaprenyl-diphosphatase